MTEFENIIDKLINQIHDYKTLKKLEQLRALYRMLRVDLDWYRAHSQPPINKTVSHTIDIPLWQKQWEEKEKRYAKDD